MRIENILLNNVPPFASRTLTFPLSPVRGKVGEVHLFTGPNGTGKSRLLAMLAASTDAEASGMLKRFGLPRLTNQTGGGIRKMKFGDQCIVGVNGDRMLGFAFSGSVQLQLSPLEILKGVALPIANERLSFNSWNFQGINQRIANQSVQAAMELMNGEVDDPGRSLAMARKLEKVITEITGKKFSVITQAHPTTRLMFRWGNKNLPIEGLPAGLNSLISWMFAAATIMDANFPDSRDPLGEEAFFFLDEPESFLHPEWQRRILPMAQMLFSNSQFFVATHSPFVVSSVNEGFIYKLNYGADDIVEVTDAIPASKGDSYMHVLSEILGMSEWFDPESEKLLANFRRLKKIALDGSSEAEVEARALADALSQRSDELSDIMGMEIRQLDRVKAQREGKSEA